MFIASRRALLGGAQSISAFLASKGWTGSVAGRYISPLGPIGDRYWLPTLGSELVSAGIFADVSTAPATASFDGSTVTLTITTGVSRGQFTLSTTAGSIYKAVFTWSGIDAGTSGYRAGTTQNGTDVLSLTAATNTTYTIYFKALSATTYFQFLLYNTADVATVSAISVKEVTDAPQFVSQATYDAQFVATSTAARSYFDSSGVLKNDLVANQPRYSYESPRGQVLENSVTNYLQQSGAMSASPWGKVVSGSSDITATAAQGTAPDGTNALTELVFTASGAGENIIWRQSVSGLTNPTTLQPSLWISASSPVTMYLRRGDASVFESITVTTTPQRLSVSSGSNASTSFNFDLSTKATSGSTASVATVYIWGAQLENNRFVSHYIPTTSSAVTRAIETDRKAAAIEALLSGDFAVFVDMKATKPFGATARRFVGGSSANYLIGGNTSNETGITAYNGSTTLAATLGSGSILTRLKAVNRKSAAGRAICANGGTVAQDASAGTNTKLYIGRDESNTAYGDGIYYAEVFFPASAIGMTLGSELVTNGTNLVNTTGWNAFGLGPATLGVSSGSLSVTAVSDANDSATQNLTLISGEVYQVSVTNTGSNTPGLRVATTEGGTDIVNQAIGLGQTYTGYFKAPQTSIWIRIRCGAGGPALVNNISVKRVTHTFDSRMPTLTALS